MTNYKNNNFGGNDLQKEIIQLSSPADNMQFQQRSVETRSQKNEYFKTTKFDIKITIICQKDNQCSRAVYYGRRIKDGAELRLNGKVNRASCSEENCPVLSFEFINGGTKYILSKIDNSLMVMDNDNIILNQKGAWNKQGNQMHFTPSFNGRWRGEVNDSARKEPASTMSIWLKENNGALIGQYCLIYNYGSRIDCTDDDAINMTGHVVEKNRAIINFDTWFNEKGGKAEIFLDGDKATWQLLNKPVNSQHYIPEMYKFIREKASP